MIKQEALDGCFCQLLDAAFTAYRETPEHKLLQEKLAQMDRDCNGMLMPDQKAFVEECFDLLADVSARRERYLYRRGMVDSVWLLQSIGAL